jgi:hypothetical protein
MIFGAHRYFAYLVFLFITSAIVALGINATYFHYPGNSYYPDEAPWIFFVLCLTYAGICLLWGKQSLTAQKIREIIYLFFSMALIILGCTAIQYTPFNPIDQTIINWSQWTQLDLTRLLHWSATHPMIYQIMEILYDTVPLQLTYLPFILICFGVFNRLHEYYFLLLVTAFMGYAFYYFFPTTAPASMLESPYFTEAQRATGLKFYQIHAHITPTTVKGGMIASPSFHVIWGWLCAFLIRDYRWVFGFVCLLNIAMTVSCVLLGWHYILDLMASFFVVLIAHIIYLRVNTVQSNMI